MARYDPEPSDPFETAAIRARVLAAWTSSPARFREDANTEEDFALGGYRDRLVVELAQNAADAAARAGVPGRLRLTLRNRTLVAANTGAPLTSEGIEALATLRASAKAAEGPGTVGRFGVGFAAVLAVSEEPVVLSRTGGVRFSRADTAEQVGEVPALRDEVARREGHVPVLRLPYEAAGEPPEGFDTAVILPLRDDPAEDLVRRLLDEIDDALLLALPGLDTVEVDAGNEIRTYADARTRWRVHTAGGTLPENLFADRPTEERARPFWSVLWAIPRGPVSEIPRTLHAPTPTDEPISLPALLIASFPLDPSRRHVAPGPLADRLVEEAAKAYTAFVLARASEGEDVLPMVPTGLAAGRVDAALREAILDELRRTHLAEAVVVDGLHAAAADVLAPIVPGLRPDRRSERAALDALHVRRMGLAELVDELAGVARPPVWWRSLYEAFGEAVEDPMIREELGSITVPLADGRTARGPRGVLLPYAEIPERALTDLVPYGIRIAHPEAVSPTLERLGARPATPRELLEESAVRQAVVDGEDLADAVLPLVARAAIRPGDLPWLASLSLPDAHGDLVPAGSMVLPGSPAEGLLDPEEFEPVPEELVEEWGADVLEAAGVVRTLGLVRENDVDPDDPPDTVGYLAEVEDWLVDLDEPIGEFAAIRDLEFVREESWPQALDLIARDRGLRRAVTQMPSYSAWFIARRLGLVGTADPDAARAVRELCAAPPDFVAALDPELRGRLGLITTLDDITEAHVAPLLARLADPDVVLDAAGLLVVWRKLGGLELPDDLPDPPDAVRILDGDGTRLVDTGDAVVVDSPMWLERTTDAVFATPETAEILADLFDIPVVEGESPDDAGVPVDVPEVVRRLLPDAAQTWWEHEDLRVGGESVEWWVDPADRPHAATTRGLARALAWSAGSWSTRYAVEAALTDPDSVAEILAEQAYDRRA